MEHGFINLPIITGIVYILIHVVKTKFIKKQQLNVKELLRNSIINVVSVIIAQQLITQFSPLSSFIGMNSPVVFTNDPDF